MNEKMPLLDHGYVQFIEKWGSDERIIEAARMSTDKGFVRWGGVPCPQHNVWIEDGPESLPVIGCDRCIQHGDEKLLKYLWDHKHATPFEMAGMTIEVKAPIFVFREWHRHRTQSYNEMSARYTPLPDVNYIPSVERLMINAGASNKQAGTVKDAETLTEHAAKVFQGTLESIYTTLEVLYQANLSAGVPKELARLCIPVGRYSKMRASANLRNWLAFLTLRMDQAAQWEIRQYANEVARLIEQFFPRTYQLFAAEGNHDARHQAMARDRYFYRH